MKHKARVIIYRLVSDKSVATPKVSSCQKNTSKRIKKP